MIQIYPTTKQSNYVKARSQHDKLSDFQPLWPDEIKTGSGLNYVYIRVP